ncbi:SidA/IucD/PvdA family monooxygenase [Phytomonospora sp. NPDC050363]|uniref:lysine N(6)-hydroxylase/L-ornithine N(5)-oxygenase family protein n=1 Tax=Phytomonospora sp. NPDC050363 TaxID=3155642 RepID=UPI00340EE9B1
MGVGPANLSLASLLHGRQDFPNLFLEQREKFGWHDGQLLHDASLQVSMLKDLVTLADPTNPFSFLSYLHSRGRMYHFINAQFEAVPRKEYRNYLEWACGRNENLAFGESVLSIGFDGDFIVETTRRLVIAANVVVGVGMRPWVPLHVAGSLGPSQFHAAEYLRHLDRLPGARVVVVGGGQSGAEIVLDLINRRDADLPRQVSWLSRRPNYFPIDDSPFTNDYFTPPFSDFFARLDEVTRKDFNGRHVLASDGASESTLRQIYQRLYRGRFIDRDQVDVALLPGREVSEVARTDSGWRLSMMNRYLGAPEQVEGDVVIWATGFRRPELTFLAPIADRLERVGDEFRVDRDFAVAWDGPTDRSLFLQNATRQQRGLADPNLSLLAWRSKRIADRMLGRPGDEPVESFVDWSGETGGQGADR